MPWPATPPRPTLLTVTALLAVTPPPPGVPLGGLGAPGRRVTGQQPARPGTLGPAAAWLGGDSADRVRRHGRGGGPGDGAPRLDYPPLLEEADGRLALAPPYRNPAATLPPLAFQPLDDPPPGADADALAAAYHGPLNDRQVDLVLVVPERFRAELFAGGVPTLTLLGREKDETARLARVRLGSTVRRWQQDLKEVRLARRGLPVDYDVVLAIADPEKERTAGPAAENLFTLLVRVFPFVLVMWSLAGALYPAIDLCAGEKERGTMETLLISPASREEIVSGKFLTIWIFSAATALLNLLSMAITTWQVSAVAPGGTFHPWALFWAVFLLLPLSAFFSAVCLAVGAYARSSKEGQYYLMPLFLLTMPLIFLTLSPGVELNPFYSMVPVTGVALLLQRLMVADTLDHGLWLYFVPVLAPMVIYSWLALRWAIGQFNREEVLFREAERLDLGLWLKRLLREKEPLPSAGEAIFCFGLILVLRWVSFGVGGHLSLLTRTGIAQLAFVATPPLLMALLLTSRPRDGLALRRPPWWAVPAAVVLALLTVPPLAELTYLILRQFPGLQTLLELNHPLTHELRGLASDGGGSWGLYLLVLAVLPALCEEVAFRGFILQGLRRGFPTWTAVLLSAFLFSLYQMNVFQFVPHFVFGVVLGLLTVRSGSLLPAMVFHLTYNSLVMAPALLPGVFGTLTGLAGAGDPSGQVVALRVLLSTGCTVAAAVGLFALWRYRRDPAAGTA
ncbi:MAG: ABC transporter permease subunit/CPBP intramembrane protease [Gemmataceae bacterium]